MAGGTGRAGDLGEAVSYAKMMPGKVGAVPGAQSPSKVLLERRFLWLEVELAECRDTRCHLRGGEGLGGSDLGSSTLRLVLF